VVAITVGGAGGVAVGDCGTKGVAVAVLTGGADTAGEVKVFEPPLQFPAGISRLR
jgi:hypothetical protein